MLLYFIYLSEFRTIVCLSSNSVFYFILFSVYFNYMKLL